MPQKRATIRNIKEWANRIKKLVPDDDKDLLKRKSYIIRHCPYRDDNFCNGRPIHQKSKKKRKCPFFENGKCSKELHKGAKKENG